MLEGSSHIDLCHEQGRGRCDGLSCRSLDKGETLRALDSVGNIVRVKVIFSADLSCSKAAVWF